MPPLGEAQVLQFLDEVLDFLRPQFTYNVLAEEANLENLFTILTDFDCCNGIGFLALKVIEHFFDLTLHMSGIRSY